MTEIYINFNLNSCSSKYDKTFTYKGSTIGAQIKNSHFNQVLKQQIKISIKLIKV